MVPTLDLSFSLLDLFFRRKTPANPLRSTVACNSKLLLCVRYSTEADSFFY